MTSKIIREVVEEKMDPNCRARAGPSTSNNNKITILKKKQPKEKNKYKIIFEDPINCTLRSVTPGINYKKKKTPRK